MLCRFQVVSGLRDLDLLRKGQKTRQSTVQEVNGGQSWLSPPLLMAPKHCKTSIFGAMIAPESEFLESHEFPERRVVGLLLGNARLFIILFVRNFWRVCSQFWLSVRNSVSGAFNRKPRGNPSLCWLGGGGSRGTKIVNKNFVNKLAFPIYRLPTYLAAARDRNHSHYCCPSASR